MKNFQKMMRQAQKMQQQLEAEMEQLRVETSSAGGMVTVTMDGKKQVLSIRLHPEAVDPEDVAMLEDLILTAVNEANRKVDRVLNERVGGLGKGMLG